MCAVLLIAVGPGFIYHARAWPVEQGRDVFRLLAENRRPDETVYLNYASYYTYRYHALADDSPASTITTKTQSWTQALRDLSIPLLCRTFKAAAGAHHKGERIWFASTHVPYAHVYYKELPEYCRR